MENSLARTEASQTRLNHRFTKLAHTFSNLNIEDLQLANVKRRLDEDLKLERLLAVTACHSSAFGVSYTETRKAISIQYTEMKRLIRDLSGLGQISREALKENLNRSFQGKRKGSANVICNKDKPFAIQHIRKTSQVLVKCHYTFTNEFGFTFES